MESKERIDRKQKEAQRSAGRKGLLAVSFGTTFPATRERTIRAIEASLQAAFPERRLREAFTSDVIRGRIQEAEGIRIPDVSEALLQMASEGMTDLLVQPTHIINGIENQKMLEAVKAVREASGLRIRVGNALLQTEEDCREAAEAMLEFLREAPGAEEGNARKDLQDPLHRSMPDLHFSFPSPTDITTAYVLMGHGSEDAANVGYTKMQEQFRKLGYENCYVPTVEGLPRIEEALREMQRDCLAAGREPYRRVVLAPFMIVAGDHVTNDMVSDSPDSWKRILEREGYEVHCILRGLGECEGIRRMFIRHAKEAEVGSC